jgi:hypothetical protein
MWKKQNEFCLGGKIAMKERVEATGEVAHMQSKKRTNAGTGTRTEESKATPRPVGMQTMGPTIYEQIRRVLMELKPVSEN